MLESLRGVYTTETHYFGGFERQHYPEIVEVFGRPPSHVVGRVNFLPALPLVLSQVDFTAQDTCNLSKDVGQLISDFIMEGQQMGPKIGLPNVLN